ncbi:unnamed protein product, partial [Amoebophrya sp. A120]|eukprot:GSA120T00011527001.1
MGVPVGGKKVGLGNMKGVTEQQQTSAGRSFSPQPRVQTHHTVLAPNSSVRAPGSRSGATKKVPLSSAPNNVSGGAKPLKTTPRPGSQGRKANLQTPTTAASTNSGTTGSMKNRRKDATPLSNASGKTLVEAAAQVGRNDQAASALQFG